MTEKKKKDWGKRWVVITYQFFDVSVDDELASIAKEFGGEMASFRIDSKSHLVTMIFNKFANEKKAEGFANEVRNILLERNEMLKTDHKKFLKRYDKEIMKHMKGLAKEGLKFAEILSAQSIPFNPFVKLNTK